MRITFNNPEGSVIGKWLDENTVEVFDPNHPEWDALVAIAEQYRPAYESTEEELEAMRAEALEKARGEMRLSFAQLLIGLVAEQWITEADGEGWLTGTLPAPVLAVINTLPQEQRFAAKARALRPSEVLRADPLVAAMGTAAGKTETEIDDFFRKYAGV